MSLSQGPITPAARAPRPFAAGTRIGHVSMAMNDEFDVDALIAEATAR